MRTRSRNRRIDLEPPPAPLPFPDAPASVSSEPEPRRRASTPRQKCSKSAIASSSVPSSNPPDLSPSRRSDIVLRNVAVLAVIGAITLTFLNIFLYVAIFSVGLLAPAWQTFKALEARDAVRNSPVEVIEVSDDDDPDDDDYIPPGTRDAHAVPTVQENHAEAGADALLRNWQTYWVMAAMLFAADGLVLSPLIAPLLPRPLYAAGLFSTVAWLTRNRGGNAHALYAAVVRPAFLRSEQAIDHAVEVALTHVDAVSRHAVVQVNQMVAPYARQLEHAAAVTTKQLQEQATGRFGRKFTRGRFAR